MQLFHATAPTCWWSWGYEATLNRVRLVYGDQVEVRLLVGCVYEDFNEYLEHYGITVEDMKPWAEEAAEIMDTPIATEYRREHFPPTLMPVSLAVMAARRQGEDKADRLARATLRRYCVELQDVTRPESLEAAAREAGLDLARFRRDLADAEAREHDMAHQGHGFPHVPLGFYNLALTDGATRTLLLDHAFEPKLVEEGIDFLSGGTLAKRSPLETTSILEYVREKGPTPLIEVARVFDLSRAEAERELKGLESKGDLRVTTLAGAPHWHHEDFAG